MFLIPQLNAIFKLRLDHRNSRASNKLAEKYFHVVMEVKMKVTTPCRAIADLYRRQIMRNISTLIILFMKSTTDSMSKGFIIFERNKRRDPKSYVFVNTINIPTKLNLLPES